MGELSIPMSLPLDADGFLRRECPNCKREFKWRHITADEEALVVESSAPVDAYYCPYCYEPSPPDAWWTREQLDYAKQMAMAEVLGPSLRRFQRQIRRMNTPGGLVRVDANISSPSRPEPLSEQNDMVRVDFPCHPEEPVKVEEGWDGEVACLTCGIRYPIELVRELPETNTED